MSITEYNDNPHAPRDLCPFERCPPPTLRDSRFGSMQWVIEAIVNLALTPTPQLDPDTLLQQPTGDQIVTRIAFPFLPSFQDVSPLRDEPLFGQDLRKDSFGIKKLSEEEVESRKGSEMGRVRGRGGKWEVYVKGFSVGKGTVWSELYTPDEALTPAGADTFPILVFLKHSGTQSSLKSLFRATNPKPVHLRRATVALLRTTSTRGGKERQPHVKNALVRQQEFFFGGQSSTSPGLAITYEETDPTELDLTFDLQSTTASGNYPCAPAKSCIPSFRTPNFQYEFFITVSLLFSEDDIEWFVGRFPIQITPTSDEEGNQLPAFEDTVPDDVAPPTFDESVDTS